MKTKNVFLIYTSLVLVLLTACAGPTPEPTPTPTPIPTAEVPVDASVSFHFVTNKLMVPTTKEQTQTFALNLDGDSQQVTDNLFGSLITLLLSTSPELKLQPAVDEAVNAGQMLMLHVVQAGDPLNSPSASWSIFQGETSQSAPKFDGSDSFTVAPAAVLSDSLIPGSITNGHFAGGPGTARVQMALLGLPVEMDLIGVRLEADVSEAGCTNGKLGGGVAADEFRAILIPALVDGLNSVIEADKTAAGTILPVFDADQSGSISIAEVQNNVLLQLATSPDLDLLDASGNFNPRQDGVKDAISVGLGFTCVPAVFTAPEK